jgi:hypothetical protein
LGFDIDPAASLLVRMYGLDTGTKAKRKADQRTVTSIVAPSESG